MLKIEDIRELIQLIDQSSIDEFTYETNGMTVTLKKHPQQQVETKQIITPPPQVTPVVKQEEVPQEDTNTQQEPVAQAPAHVDYDYEIVSPMVGTFYRKPSPESEPYVTVGSKVTEDTVVCIVEAMKLFNEIEAEVSGEIVEILVEDGELVEYNQPLFRVKKH